MRKTEPAVIDDADAETTFTATGGHRDFSGLNVQLMPVRLETNQIPLLDAACFASISKDSCVRQKAVFCTVGEHIIPPALH